MVCRFREIALRPVFSAPMVRPHARQNGDEGEQDRGDKPQPAPGNRPSDEGGEAPGAHPAASNPRKQSSMAALAKGLALFSFITGMFFGTIALCVGAAMWLNAQIGFGVVWYPLFLIAGLAGGGWIIVRELRRRGAL
jgi:hypothetical protein